MVQNAVRQAAYSTLKKNRIGGRAELRGDIIQTTCLLSPPRVAEPRGAMSHAYHHGSQPLNMLRAFRTGGFADLAHSGIAGTSTS